MTSQIVFQYFTQYIFGCICNKDWLVRIFTFCGLAWVIIKFTASRSVVCLSANWRTRANRVGAKKRNWYNLITRGDRRRRLLCGYLQNKHGSQRPHLLILRGLLQTALYMRGCFYSNRRIRCITRVALSWRGTCNICTLMEWSCTTYSLSGWWSVGVAI